MQQWFYDIIISLYGLGISIASAFNNKAQLWVSGRRNWRDGIASALKQNQLPVVWIHAASLGEFEQGRPIIESLRNQKEPVFILLTFFSPSGYEIRKDYDSVDHVAYIPLDTRVNARDFVQLVKPTASVFIKYEFWFNHLHELKQFGCKIYLASGRFYPKQGFFQSWGSWQRKGLGAFNHFFVQDEESGRLLKSIGIRNYTVNGDTRFDRVIAIKEEAHELPKIRDFVDQKPCLVVGSSWPQEEMRILSFLNEFGSDKFKVILAPHEIRSSRIDAFALDCNRRVVCLSKWKGEDADVMFIDSIGLLAHVYRYASVAFIGGAFGEGLHNVLEPAVWSIPVLFGPRYFGFQEALGLLDSGGAMVVEAQEQLNQSLLELLFNQELRLTMGEAAGAYCTKHKGATAVVVEELFNVISEKS